MHKETLKDNEGCISREKSTGRKKDASGDKRKLTNIANMLN